MIKSFESERAQNRRRVENDKYSEAYRGTKERKLVEKEELMSRAWDGMNHITH